MPGVPLAIYRNHLTKASSHACNFMRVVSPGSRTRGPSGHLTSTGRARTRPDQGGVVDELRLLFAVSEFEEDAPPTWQDRALCAQTDPEAFFPEKGGSTREAKRVCTGCEVRGECLEYALARDERFGIWGGMSERERRRLKRAAG